MATGEALHAAEVPDRKRFALSLAGAILISSVGFALIMVLMAKLAQLILVGNGQPTPMIAALLPIFRQPITRVLMPMMPMLMVFPAILMAARKRRKASTDRGSET